MTDLPFKVYKVVPTTMQSELLAAFTNAHEAAEHMNKKRDGCGSGIIFLVIQGELVAVDKGSRE